MEYKSESHRELGSMHITVTENTFPLILHHVF